MATDRGPLSLTIITRPVPPPRGNRPQMSEPHQFPYDLAFDRNLGLLTDWEQLALRAKRVAIAGAGGAGGAHLLTLARLGIGAFTIADFDQFEFVNFNRQAGATVPTVGRDKIAVLEEMARAINPELRIRRFDAGVTPGTVDDFLRGADLFVDGFDFFAVAIRRQVFARCAELGIPAVTAAPIGMGVAFIAFDPKGMTFEQYFRLEGRPEQEQHLRFLLGLAPRALHRGYVVDLTRIDLDRQRGPSTIAACQLCAGVTAVAAIKLLLRRGDVMPAPYNHQFDPYRWRYHATRLALGNAGPLQRLKIAAGRMIYSRYRSRSPIPDPPTTGRTAIEEILNLARWAPSGDNAQPWRFTVIDDETVRVQIRHDRGHIYEYRDGEPTWLSAGMLLETMRIAATAWQRETSWEQGPPDTLMVRFRPAQDVDIDPLLSFVTLRSVDRQAYRRRHLTVSEKASLGACLTGGLTIEWHESIQSRWRIARLSAIATGIRMRCPEAFSIHQRIIDWDHAQSPTGIPARAVGLSPLTLRLMRWAMSRWARTKRLNSLGGALTAGCQMDYWPGLASAGYFVVRRSPAAVGKTAKAAELIEIGSSLQRFWLTATKLGLAVQPMVAALAFAHYGQHQIQFSSELHLSEQSERLAESFRLLLGTSGDVMFIGRIGEPRPKLPIYRSTRLPLAELLI
jgi:molybdopterin/thiamine biosynthesis adenylyltransferase